MNLFFLDSDNLCPLINSKKCDLNYSTSNFYSKFDKSPPIELPNPMDLPLPPPDWHQSMDKKTDLLINKDQSFKIQNYMSNPHFSDYNSSLNSSNNNNNTRNSAFTISTAKHSSNQSCSSINQKDHLSYSNKNISDSSSQLKKFTYGSSYQELIKGGKFNCLNEKFTDDFSISLNSNEMPSRQFCYPNPYVDIESHHSNCYK